MMHIRVSHLLFGLSLLFFFACSKSELETVPSNQAPPDTTIETTVYEDYINRTYILVLGREPDSTEFQQAYDLLKSEGLSMQSRYDFLDIVFSGSDYAWRQVNRWRLELLNNIDSSDIGVQIAIFDFLLGDSTNQAFWPVIQTERDRLQTLYNVSYDYVGGLVSIREMQAVMINNYFYDQINMGADNFVISSFQHFLGRNPTLDEQSSGVSMLNGSNAILFLQTGASKDDYLSIFFDSDDYFEGAVRRVYEDYLLRTPGSMEMSTAALKYRNSLDFEAVQKDVLATDEFAGLDN